MTFTRNHLRRRRGNSNIVGSTMLVMMLICYQGLAQSDAVNFKEFMSKIDPSIVSEEGSIPLESFTLLSVQNQNNDETSLRFVSDSELTVAISRNLFVDRERSLIDYDLLVYSRKHKRLLIFAHRNEQSDSCRSFVSVFDLVPYIFQCFIFDDHYKYVGEMQTQFYLKDNRTYFEWVKDFEGKRVFHGKHLTQADKYNGQSYKLVNYPDFKNFVNIILRASVEKIQPDKTWKGFVGNNAVINKVEQAR